VKHYRRIVAWFIGFSRIMIVSLYLRHANSMKRYVRDILAKLHTESEFIEA
jgi:hypothetical protein